MIYILWLRENTEANDITINSYLRRKMAFLYYCIECNLLHKPDVDYCSFSAYKTWVFENYLLGTGNRISTPLNVHIGNLNFEDGTITLCKIKNRKQ